MGFSEKVQADALVACGRCCCICHKFCGTKIALHHIKQKAYGGDDSFDNCIPLCLDCHEDMGKADPHHVTGKHYTEKELRMHRDKWYKQCSPQTTTLEEVTAEDIENLFKDRTLVLDGGNAQRWQGRYLSIENRGRFTFDYSNNDGKYTIGSGECEFVTAWSKASDRSIHAYKDHLGIGGAIARVKAPKDWPVAIDESCDFSSRTRTPDIGDVVIWKNSSGKYAATRILDIKDDTRGADHDELTCDYVIYSDTPHNQTVSAEMQNAAGGHTVIIDDEKYIAERIVEEHDREIERLLSEI